MKDKNSHSYLVPPADMVLDLIRSAPEAEDSFCPFTSPIFDGCCCGTRLNEDLRQEMSITLVRSLIPLRRKLIRYLNGECILVLIVPPPVS